MKSRFTTAGLALLALALSASLPSLATAEPLEGGKGGPPRSLRHLVLHPGHRPVHSVALGETKFEFLALREGVPFLLWPAEGQAVAFEQKQDEVQRWLTAQLPALGVQGFEPAFENAWSWRENVVWTYHLQRAGLELHDARIDFHWLNGEFQGLRALIERPILGRAEDPTTGAQSTEASTERVWFARRRIERDIDGYDMVIAEVQREVGERNTHARYVLPGGQLLSTIVSSTNIGPQQEGTAFAWDEYNVPSGTFPDQLGSDSTGRVWFSQPLNNKVTVFDPVAETFSSPPQSIPSPDGMIVDSQDRLWTGLYVGGAGLGMLDTTNGNYVAFPASYANAVMAIPFETVSGEIWVTDHERNRVSIFDPQTSTFTSSMVMPTAGAWVVDGAQDPTTQTMYFQEYSTNKLAIKPVGQPMFDIPTPTGGPAFVVYSRGKVYIGLWAVGRLAVYDIASGLFTTHDYPDTGNVGGPVDVLSNGDIVATGRNFGAIYIFHPDTLTFDRYLIPTAGAGIKDGVHADANDVIWVAETNANKLGKLHLQNP